MKINDYKHSELQEILKLDIFTGSKVVGGEKGLTNHIKSVTVAEVPDSANWIVGGELVVSTGYYMKNNIDIQKKWFESLIEQGASALAIKPDRFLGKKNNELNRLADKHNFPLIELPLDIVWPDIIKSVTEYLLSYQSNIISRTEEIHNRLTDLVLVGGGLGAIVKTLANLIGAPIVVEDFQVNILSLSIPENTLDISDSCIKARKSNEYVKKFKNSRAYRESISNRDKKFYSLFMKIDDVQISQKVMPIVADNVLYGFLSVLETDYKQVNNIDVLALEHGATTIALEMVMERNKIESSNHEKSTLMYELIEGDIKRAVSSYVNHKITSYEILNPSIVLIISVKNNDQSWIDKNNEFFFRERFDKKISRYVERRLTTLNYKTFVNMQGNQCVVLISYPDKVNKFEFVNQLKEDSTTLLNELLKEFPQNDYVIGISEPYFQIERLKDSYKKAISTIHLSEKFFGLNNVSVYNDLGILKLLSLVENQKEVEAFSTDLIGDLIEYDNKNNDQMCHTLKAYLDNNGNNTQTAKKLFIHPNTLNYRIKKISNILGIDLKNSQERFNLFLALIIKQIFIDDGS